MHVLTIHICIGEPRNVLKDPISLPLLLSFPAKSPLLFFVVPFFAESRYVARFSSAKSDPPPNWRFYAEPPCNKRRRQTQDQNACVRMGQEKKTGEEEEKKFVPTFRLSFFPLPRFLANCTLQESIPQISPYEQHSELFFALKCP